LNHIKNHKLAQPKLARSTFSSTMSRPAAEEQFLEQNPWANPQHPIHQQHMGRLSRPVSDQTRGADSAVTPAARKSSIDPNKPAGSASTIPEHPSAQASSALATPYANNNEVPQHQGSKLTAMASDQQHATGFDKPHQQKERLQSLSPTETRKHNLSTYDPGPSKAASTGGAVTGIEEIPSQPFRPSRLALFGSPARRNSLPRNGPSGADMEARHAASSPITLHQHAMETNLTPAAGLSRIGAR
jgi:hypothetical protein